MSKSKLKSLRQMGLRFRHKKTGGIYKVVAVGRLETGLMPCVVYESERDGLIWIRPQHEFNDGRFDDITGQSQ